MVLLMGRKRQGDEREKKDNIVPLIPTNFRHIKMFEEAL